MRGRSEAAFGIVHLAFGLFGQGGEAKCGGNGGDQEENSATLCVATLVHAMVCCAMLSAMLLSGRAAAIPRRRTTKRRSTGSSRPCGGLRGPLPPSAAAVNHGPEEPRRRESRLRDSGRDSGFMNHDYSARRGDEEREGRGGGWRRKDEG